MGNLKAYLKSSRITKLPADGKLKKLLNSWTVRELGSVATVTRQRGMLRHSAMNAGTLDPRKMIDFDMFTELIIHIIKNPINVITTKINQ